MTEQEARNWNKTAVFGYTCKVCRRVYLSKAVQQWDTKWEERNGEECLVETRNTCPHCGHVTIHGPNDIELHQPEEDGQIL